MKAYRAFMADFVAKNEDYGLTMKMVSENLEWSRKKIREEALIAAYGVDSQKRMTTELDPQLQRAIARPARIPAVVRKGAPDGQGFKEIASGLSWSVNVSARVLRKTRADIFFHDDSFCDPLPP